MDLNLFRRITREMRGAGVEEIGVFYLGESFTKPAELHAAIKYLKQDLQIPYVFLTTNGSLADPQTTHLLMNAGLDSLKWSINAATPEQFKEVMGVKPELFEKSLENLKSTRQVRDSHKYPCRLYASSIRYDGEQQVLMERLLQDQVLPYVDQHYWLPLYSMGSVATTREAELGYRPIAGNQGRVGALRDPLPCWACFTEAHVTSDGLLSACCFDADGRFAMADLTQVSFMEGWHSESFQELRQAHLQKDVSTTVCEECIVYA